MGGDPHFARKRVYISGGSSGIGLACARKFSRSGADVFIFARTSATLEAASDAVKESRASPTQRVAWACVDVTDHGVVAAVLKEAFSDFGAPDVVVTCAGIAYPDYFENIGQEHFDLTLRTNLLGTWNVLKAAIPAMQRPGGHIVTVSSVAGFLGVFGYTAYSASKFGVMGLSEALRAEMKPRGIRVSVLCPPDTDTPGLAFENRTKPVETRALGSRGGLMSAEDVADALLRGMKRGRFLIVPGLEGTFIHAAKRFVPGLVFSVMDAIVARSRRSGGGGPA